MQGMNMQNMNEVIALVTSVLLGTGAYIGVVNLKKKETINLSFVLSVLAINMLVTYVLSEFLKSRDMGEYRAYGLPLIAFGGQYLIDWLDKRYLKIFDTGLKKTTGLDVGDEKEKNNESINNSSNNKEGDSN